MSSNNQQSTPEYYAPRFDGPQYVQYDASPNASYASPQAVTGPTYTTPPSYSDSVPLTVPDDGKFQATGFRDIAFAILFLIHLVVMLIIGGVSSGTSSGSDDVLPQYYSSEFHLLMATGLTCAVAGAVCAFVWLAVLRRWARQLIILSLTASVLVWAAFAIFVFSRGQIVFGVFMLLIAAFHGLLYYWWRRRIPFAVAMLETVSRLINMYPATAYVAYASLLVQIVWVAVWVWIVSRVQYLQGASQGILIFFLVLSFYWTAQVIKNTVHVTASGLFATWYFLSGVGMPPQPTLHSLRRATTTSFGSVCLGSLLVAFLQTLRHFARALREHGGSAGQFVACIAEFVLGCVENLVRYFNIYAFTQVAIYGKSYCQAARDTWTLIQSHGIEAIINDNLISSVLFMGSLLGGVCGALVGGIMGYYLVPTYWIGCVFLGFLISYAMVILTMEVVESGVATVFVCFAMDPEALKRNDPSLYQVISSTYGQY